MVSKVMPRIFAWLFILICSLFIFTSGTVLYWAVCGVISVTKLLSMEIWRFRSSKKFTSSARYSVCFPAIAGMSVLRMRDVKSSA